MEDIENRKEEEDVVVQDVEEEVEEEVEMTKETKHPHMEHQQKHKDQLLHSVSDSNLLSHHVSSGRLQAVGNSATTPKKVRPYRLSIKLTFYLTRFTHRKFVVIIISMGT